MVFSEREKIQPTIEVVGTISGVIEIVPNLSILSTPTTSNANLSVSAMAMAEATKVELQIWDPVASPYDHSLTAV